MFKLLETLFNVSYIAGYNEFFSWEAKKKDLSDKSRDGEDSKKVKESDSPSYLLDEAFSDALNYPELGKSHEVAKEFQIKVTESLEFMSSLTILKRKLKKDEKINELE